MRLFKKKEKTEDELIRERQEKFVEREKLSDSKKKKRGKDLTRIRKKIDKLDKEIFAISNVLEAMRKKKLRL